MAAQTWSWRNVTENHPRLKAVLDGLKSVLPPVNFITVHYAYFVVVCLFSSVVFWLSSDPAFSVSYVDSLYLVVSAMTEAGLNTVNLSEVTTWQQVMLCLLIAFGGAVWVSIWTVLARKHIFEQRFRRVVQAERLRSRRPDVVEVAAKDLEKTQSKRESSNEKAAPIDSLAGRSPRAVGGQSTSISVCPINAADVERKPGKLPPNGDQAASPTFLTTDGIAGRNGQFHSLTCEERQRLGGCEYRALRLLSVVVPLYYVLWHLLGCLALGAWIANNLPQPALANGVSPWWVGIFNGVSAFNNSGMTLLDANMMPFQDSPFVLITMGLMILAGNTGYPIFLRFILWSGLKMLNGATREGDFAEWKETLVFILKYPRRVYTHLFPARHTWWLLFMVVLINCAGWMGFELLNLGNPVVESIPLGSRILDGLFQSIAVRSGGFSVVPMSKVYTGLQILYVIMMYISVYPVVITMRHSNVYEESSLGIYADDPRTFRDMEASAASHTPSSSRRRSESTNRSEVWRFLKSTFLPWYGVGSGSGHDAGDSRLSFLSQQIHGQLAHDMWLLVLAVFLISTIETGSFLADPVTYSVFNVVFEVVSAYGCVGVSTGLPTASYSFSGGWHSASKVILCLVMIRGRHRGLPVALDRAVRLPGEHLSLEEEEEDHRASRSLTIRRVSMWCPSLVQV